MIKYYPFTLNDIFEGVLDAAQDASVTIEGNRCEPNNIVKLGYNEGYSTDSLTFTSNLDYSVSISALELSDWDTTLKTNYLTDWFTYLGASAYINTSVFTDVLNSSEFSSLIESLSGPSIAYVNQDNSTLEISVGVNAYNTNFYNDWFSNTSNILACVLLNTIASPPHYVSNVMKLTYKGYTDYVWSFNAAQFVKYTGDGVDNGSILLGGGNIFTEIRLAALEEVAHYVVKKNFHIDDPYLGLCSIGSSYDEPFCIGQTLQIIDDSVYTSRLNDMGTNGLDSWNWSGGHDQLDNIWHIADISTFANAGTNGCENNAFKAVKIEDFVFPVRVIANCKVGDFS